MMTEGEELDLTVSMHDPKEVKKQDMGLELI